MLGATRHASGASPGPLTISGWRRRGRCAHGTTSPARRDRAATGPGVEPGCPHVYDMGAGGRMAPDEVAAYLRSLPTRSNDAGPGGRQALALALLTKLEVEGYHRTRYELTPEAVDRGLGAALPA